MNAHVGEFLGAARKSRDSGQIRLNVTHSGFTVACVPTSKYDHTFWVEFLLKLAGVFLIPAGGIILAMSVELYGMNIWLGVILSLAVAGAIGWLRQRMTVLRRVLA